jgi:parallel beta-helix repeat protein
MRGRVSSRQSVDRGLVFSNLENGIETFDNFFGGSLVLTGNTAVRNGQLGIRAQSSEVLDGGGNRASGNGDPRQCTGVVCSP